MMIVHRRRFGDGEAQQEVQVHDRQWKIMRENAAFGSHHTLRLHHLHNLIKTSSRYADVLIYSRARFIVVWVLFLMSGIFWPKVFFHLKSLPAVDFFADLQVVCCFYVADIINFHMWLESLVSSTQIELQLFLIFFCTLISLCGVCLFAPSVLFFSTFFRSMFSLDAGKFAS